VSKQSQQGVSWLEGLEVVIECLEGLYVVVEGLEVVMECLEVVMECLEEDVSKQSLQGGVG